MKIVKVNENNENSFVLSSFFSNITLKQN